MGRAEFELASNELAIEEYDGHPLTESEARAFLERPLGKRSRTVTLEEKPSRRLLRWLPGLGNEVGITRIWDNWDAIRPDQSGVISRHMILPHYDVFLRSHPHAEDGNLEREAIPNLGDYHMITQDRKNLIVSALGMTTYTRSRNYDRYEPRIIDAMENDEFDRGSTESYRAFLEECGLNHFVVPWDELDDSTLAQLLGDYSD